MLSSLPPRWALGLLFAVFTLSGFAGLIYESIWSHYLKLFLGHSGYAQTLVLAIFMGGMAVGAWLAARYSARWRSLLVAYAVVEAAVGVIALLFHETFIVVTEARIRSHPPGGRHACGGCSGKVGARRGADPARSRCCWA